MEKIYAKHIRNKKNFLYGYKTNNTSHCYHFSNLLLTFWSLIWDKSVFQPVHDMQGNQHWGNISVRLMMLNLSDDLVVLSSASNILLGDGLVLLSASLYAVSNVCQEYTVKNLSRVEFLGMVGLFGTIISTIQM